MRAFLCLCHKQISSLPQSRTNVAIANVPAVSCDVSVFSFAMYWEDTADAGGSSLRQAFSTRLPHLEGLWALGSASVWHDQFSNPEFTNQSTCSQGEQHLNACLVCSFSLSLYFWLPRSLYFIFRASLYMEIHTH